MQKKTVVVAGATGLVGGEVCKQLQQNEDIERVFALTRGKSYDDGKIRWITTNYDEIHLLDAEISHCDAAVCCLGTTIKQAGSQDAFRKVDVEYPTKLGEWAKSKKCIHYLLVSSTGADEKSMFFYSRCKAEVENAIKNLKFASTTIVRPSLLLGDRNEFRLGEEMAKIFGFIIPKSIAPVHASDVAKSMVNKLLEGKQGVEVVESAQIERER